MLFVLLIVPALIPELSNDLIFAETRTQLYSFKILGTLNPYDFAFYALFAAWLIDGLLHAKIKLDHLLDVPMLGFLLIALLSLLNGYFNQPENIRLMFFEFINITRFVLIYFMAVNLFDYKNDSKRLFWFWTVLAVINGFYGVYRYINNMGIDLYADQQKLIFVDPAINTNFMISFLFVIAMFFKRFDNRKIILMSFLLLPAMVSFVFSYRRGLWIGLLVAVACVVLLNKKAAQKLITKKVLMIVGVLIPLLIGASFIYPKINSSIQYGIERIQTINPIKVSTESKENLDSSTYYRLIDMLNAFEAIKQNPWLGIGLGGFYHIYYGSETMHAYAVAKLNNVSHNSYLFLWMKMGILAVLLFCWMIVQSIRIGILTLLKVNESYRCDLLILTIAILISLALILLTGPLFIYAGGANLLGVTFAFAMLGVENNTESSQHARSH